MKTPAELLQEYNTSSEGWLDGDYKGQRERFLKGIVAWAESERAEAKREVLQELLDWYEYDSSNKYTPRREFDWQAAIQSMLMQKDYPHGPIVQVYQDTLTNIRKDQKEIE